MRKLYPEFNHQGQTNGEIINVKRDRMLILSDWIAELFSPKGTTVHQVAESVCQNEALTDNEIVFCLLMCGYLDKVHELQSSVSLELVKSIFKNAN